MNSTADKPALRHRLRRLRRDASFGRPDAGDALATRFPDAWAPERGALIAGYWPLVGEIDPRPLMTRLADTGARLCLPCVIGDKQPLQFREYLPGDRLENADFGVMQPEPTRPSFKPELVLVPLLGCDRRGNRLGFGKGYYDYTLAALRADGPVRAIGLAFACQVVAELPADRHDQALDGLVTEAWTLDFRNESA